MLNAKGQTYHSFVVTRYLPLEELRSTLIEVVHEPTGAQVLHIATDDEENLFSLSFQTRPKTSSGVAHILEHIVLCGSQKFPIKDPFFSMARHSLNTYMNALTGQDFTCYPASSTVEKDFYNILEVYLDAVFHPELKKMSFLQEGHRLEFLETQNPKTPLQFQGVVYNEMKGALSSPETRLWECILKYLTPDLPYALNSGGDPKEIPLLTFQELKEFHTTFYHPSRCLFFFYGNIPLTKHLDFLLDKTLQHVSKQPQLPPIPLQPRFSAPVSISEFYPISPTETVDKKTWIAFSWLTAHISNQEDVLALCLLELLLMDTDASLLKKALLKSNLCLSIDSSIDIEMSEIPFSIVCKGCEPKDASELKKIIFHTLKNATFSKEQIEACLHLLEFERTEIRAEGVPFGLSLFFRSGLIKQHGGKPENALLIHSLFEHLRKHLNDNFLSQLIHKYLINNPHFVELTFLPDPTLSEKERKEEQERLSHLRSHVDEKMILSQSKELNQYQEAQEHQSLECLPHLGLHDIPPHSRDFHLTDLKKNNLSIFHHDCFTNRIIYADLVYDLPDVALPDLPLIALYSHFITELGCGPRDYAENLAYQQAYTGGCSASLSLHVPQNTPDIFHPSLSIRAKALSHNGEKLFTLFTDMVKGVKTDDKNRVQELLLQHVNQIQNHLVKNALNYAIQLALKGFSSASFIHNEWHGFGYYTAALNWIKNPKVLSDELSRIQRLILAKGSPNLVLTCEQKVFDQLENKDFFGLSAIPTTPIEHSWNCFPKQKSPQYSAHFISSPVAFTSKGMRTINCKDPRSALLLLAAELFDNCYLHKEIREKGGAYGSGASYSPHSGNFHFYSYRDPHLASTLNHFQKSLQTIAAGKFSLDDLEDAKFSVIQTLDAPVPPGNRAMTAYCWKRAQRSYKDRDLFRQKILFAEKKEIQDAIEELLIPQVSSIVSFLGENLYRKEETSLQSGFTILS